MIEVLKYLEPLWYFNLNSEKTSAFYFLDYNKLSTDEKLRIDFDSEYKTMSLEDAAFQAFKRGFISTDPSKGLQFDTLKNTPLSDHYRFVRKYYHFGWSLYFFFIRIIMLKNPIKEVQGFLKSLTVKRISLYSKVSKKLPEKSALPKNPKVSVILPTLNRYELLKNILNDLSEQSIQAYEIIVVDQSDLQNIHFYEPFNHLPLRIIYQKNKGQWLARNEGIQNATGNFLAFIDDDTQVGPDWIEQHLQALFFFQADISAGVSIPEGKAPLRDKTFFHWAEEFDSGNAMVRRDVFKKIGLFDRTFDGLRMGDTEFGLRAYLSGLRAVSNPLANRVHIHSEKGGMRYWGSKEAFQPLSFFGARPNIGVLYLFLRYFEKKYLTSFLLSRIFLSYIPSKTKKNILGWIAGFFNFILFSPWWIWRLRMSLKKARSMQSENNKDKY